MRYLYLGLFVAPILFAGCKTPKGDTVEQKRADVQQMRQEALDELYRRKPAAKSHVEGAPGYAVFNNMATQLLITRTGYGYGIAHEKESGKDTYMRMGELGAGLGLQIKSVRVVLVFNNEKVMREFIDKGWQFGAEASAEARSKNEGGGGAEAGDFKDAISIYRLTRTGVALQVALTGTKYWKSKELN